jgi:hypothetical protein
LMEREKTRDQFSLWTEREVWNKNM